MTALYKADCRTDLNVHSSFSNAYQPIFGSRQCLHLATLRRGAVLPFHYTSERKGLAGSSPRPQARVQRQQLHRNGCVFIRPRRTWLLIDSALYQYRQDPSGVFFYNGDYDGDTSKVLTAVKYKSSTVTDPRNNQTLASVKFSNSRNEVIAEV